MHSIKLLAAVAAGLMASVVLMASVALANAPALADPNPLPPPPYDVNGVGASETDGVMNALSKNININTNSNLIASWDSGVAAIANTTTTSDVTEAGVAGNATLTATVKADNPAPAKQVAAGDGEVNFFDIKNGGHVNIGNATVGADGVTTAQCTAPNGLHRVIAEYDPKTSGFLASSSKNQAAISC